MNLLNPESPYHDNPKNFYHVWSNKRNKTLEPLLMKDVVEWAKYNGLLFDRNGDNRELRMRMENEEDFKKLKTLFGGNLLYYFSPVTTAEDLNVRVVFPM